MESERHPRQHEAVFASKHPRSHRRGRLGTGSGLPTEPGLESAAEVTADRIHSPPYSATGLLLRRRHQRHDAGRGWPAKALDRPQLRTRRKKLVRAHDLEYLDATRKGFAELAPALQRRIHNAQIVVHVIDPTTPAGVKYDIFKRINTGGTPLNAQEIRHCMSRNRSRDFLKRCTHTHEFDLATGGRFRNHIRMDDREVVLRFCAFWLRGVEEYVKEGSMDNYLEKTTAMLDDPDQVPDARLEELHHAFRNAMVNSYEVFGDHAFRKWPLSSTDRNPINRPLFECWSYALAGVQLNELQRRKSEVTSAARHLMTTNRDYLDAITTSTGDSRKVRLRFALTEAAAKAGT